jgi:hypothetical protein
MWGASLPHLQLLSASSIPWLRISLRDFRAHARDCPQAIRVVCAWVCNHAGACAPSRYGAASRKAGPSDSSAEDFSCQAITATTFLAAALLRFQCPFRGKASRETLVISIATLLHEALYLASKIGDGRVFGTISPASLARSKLNRTGPSERGWDSRCRKSSRPRYRGSVQPHPSRKNKSAARVGHPGYRQMLTFTPERSPQSTRRLSSPSSRRAWLARPAAPGRCAARERARQCRRSACRWSRDWRIHKARTWRW